MDVTSSDERRAAADAGPAIALTYTPDYAESFKVSAESVRFHYSWLQRQFQWLLLVAFFAGMFALNLISEPIKDLGYTLGDRFGYRWAPIAAAALYGIAFFLFVWGPISQYLSARWIAKRSQPSPISFAAGPEQLVWQGEHMTTTASWAAVERLFVTGTAIGFLVQNSTLFVPNSAFASEAAREEMVGYALDHVSDEVRALSLSDKRVLRLAERGSHS